MPFSNLQLWSRINENNALIYSIPSGGTSSNTTYTGLNNFVNTLKYYGNQIALFNKVRYVNEGELMSPHLADSTMIHVSCGTFTENLTLDKDYSILQGSGRLSTLFTGTITIKECEYLTIKNIWFHRDSIINILDTKTDIIFENCSFHYSTITLQSIGLRHRFVNCKFSYPNNLTFEVQNNPVYFENCEAKGFSINNKDASDKVVLLNCWNIGTGTLTENITFRGMTRYLDGTSDSNADRYYATESLPLDNDELTSKEYVDNSHKLVGFQATFSPTTGTYSPASNYEILPFDSISNITNNGSESFCYDTEGGFNTTTYKYTVKKQGYYSIKYGTHLQNTGSLLTLHVVRISTGIDSIINKSIDRFGHANIKLEIGDIVYVRTNDSDIIIEYGAANNYFSATLIGF